MNSLKRECNFCRIAEGKSPCFKIAENSKAMAFLDFSQTTKGASLVITKCHANDVFEVRDEDLKGIALLIKEVALKMRKNLNVDGVNILNASGKAAQQSVFHLHFHIIPRFANDGLNAWPFKKTLKDVNFKSISEQLKK